MCEDVLYKPLLLTVCVDGVSMNVDVEVQINVLQIKEHKSHTQHTVYLNQVPFRASFHPYTYM